MPDESCRPCGGELVTHLTCPECRKVVQKICKHCNMVTRKQFHNQCVRSKQISNSHGSQTVLVRNDRMKRQLISNRSLGLIIGMAGLIILGFSVAGYVLYSTNADTSNFLNILSGEDAAKPLISTNVVHTTSNNSYDNCLAYGSGESLTVTCPTSYGFVYKAILDMPKELAEKFSNTVLSIRSVSITENLDGSITLQYQNNYYKTNFFAN